VISTAFEQFYLGCFSHTSHDLGVHDQFAFITTQRKMMGYAKRLLDGRRLERIEELRRAAIRGEFHHILSMI